MKKRTYLSAGLALLIGTLSVHASPGLSDVKSRVLPAVYKSKNGLTQKVEISVKHEGEPSTVTIHLGEQSHKEKLVSGDNVFRIEIPEVSTTRQLPLTLTSGICDVLWIKESDIRICNMSEDSDKDHKCNNVCSRNSEINYSHKNQEDCSDHDCNHGCLTDCSRNSTDQHIHRIHCITCF